MGKSRGISGGGIEGRKVVRARSPKTEPKAYAINPGAVGKLGATVGNTKSNPRAEVEPLVAGRGYSTPVGPTSNMGMGPGANRTIMRSGSQGTHGPVVQGPAKPVQNPDMLRGFGPERSTK